MKLFPRLKAALKQDLFGLTCDSCGADVFRYPLLRLCKECEKSVYRNDGFRCEKCGRASPAEGLCLVCKREPPHFTKAASPIVYFLKGAELLNRFKEGERYLSAFFAEEMCAVLDRMEFPEPPLLVCVPTSAEKLSRRGYNPPEELAKEIAARTGYEYAEGVFVKFESGEQKHRSAKERVEKIRGSFRVKKRKPCKDRTVLVVDDVMTTGATGSECARVLKIAGAKEVYFITACAVAQKREE